MILDFSSNDIKPMACTMVDGSFDPLHEGHVRYFEEAARLGLPVLCNVAPDSWTEKKHPILLEVTRRAIVLDAIRHLSFVLIGCSSTRHALEVIQPRYFAKGGDWLNRGGIPRDEQLVCAEFKIQIVYLPTVSNSSTQLIQNLTNRV